MRDDLKYQVHIQNKGWSEWLTEGDFAGTIGEQLRLEGIKIIGARRYRVFVQNKGWGPWTDPGEIAGSVGLSLRIEAIEIQGEQTNYRTHVQNIGWMNWASNGETSGTIDGSLRIEAIQIINSKKPLKPDTLTTFVKFDPKYQPQPEPTIDLSGLTICLDAGHGGSDPGATSSVNESAMNLDVILKLGNKLKSAKASVIYTRTTDTYVSLADRTAIANNNNADLFVSVHHNSASDPSANGSETICYPGSPESFRLATLILDNLTNTLKTRKRSVIQRDDYTVTYTNMPAVISESLFVSNPNEVELFLNGGAELEATAILNAIKTYKENK